MSGPVEQELRAHRGDGYPLSLSPVAKRVFDDAHESLSVRHGHYHLYVYRWCCAEALSEAIEAAEALAL